VPAEAAALEEGALAGEFEGAFGELLDEDDGGVVVAHEFECLEDGVDHLGCQAE